MSNPKKRKPEAVEGENGGDPATQRRVGNTVADLPTWVERAETFARRDPAKAVVSAVGAGFLLNIMPVRAILGALIAIAFALARPFLLFLGLVKAWEICPCKKETKD